MNNWEYKIDEGFDLHLRAKEKYSQSSLERAYWDVNKWGLLKVNKIIIVGNVRFIP